MTKATGVVCHPANIALLPRHSQLTMMVATGTPGSGEHSRMNFFRILWDDPDGNVQHIAEHGFDIEDVDEDTIRVVTAYQVPEPKDG